MIKLFKKAFGVTNDGIVLMVPLVFFMVILSFYIMYSGSVVNTLPKMYISSITMLFMGSAFCSGWFYLIKKVVDFTKQELPFDCDKNKEMFKLIKYIPEGVEKYFPTFLFVIVIFIVVAILYFGFLLWPVNRAFIDTLLNAMSSIGIAISNPQDVVNVFEKLPKDKVTELSNLLFIPLIKYLAIVSLSTFVFSFMFQLWMPEVIYTKKNALLALFTSIKKLFKTFKNSMLLCLYIALVNVMVSFLLSLSTASRVVYLLMLFVHFYFIIYETILIFMYYDNNFNHLVVESAETESCGDSRSDG